MVIRKRKIEFVFGTLIHFHKERKTDELRLESHAHLFGKLSSNASQLIPRYIFLYSICLGVNMFIVMHSFDVNDAIELM